MLVDALHDISLEFKEEEARPRLVGAIADLAQFRAIVVAALAASVWITWPMWGPRDYPIILPCRQSPSSDLGADVDRHLPARTRSTSTGVDGHHASSSPTAW